MLYGKHSELNVDVGNATKNWGCYSKKPSLKHTSDQNIISV